MATTIDKKYLDQAGLEHLIDEKAILKHPSPDAKDPAAVKVGTDANGHVVLGTALSYNDLQNLPTIGNGKLTIQVNGKAVTGTFTANQTGDTIINITAADLGLASGMRFAGISSTDPKGTSGATVSGYTDWRAGDVVIYKRDDETSYEEYILTTGGNAAANWELLGDASSYAMKDVTITAGDGLTGGGDLSQNRTISHAQDATQAKDAAPVKTGRDAFGHVIIGGALDTTNAGKHGHSVSSTIPASTYVDTVTPGTTKISLNKKTQTVVTSVPGTFNKLETAQITGVDGTVTASKATAQTAKDVAKAGTAVVYGKADVGAQNTVATKAAAATKVGNANIATTPTTIGNADVGTDVVYGKANVGEAVTYGTANVGDAVSVATRAATQTTVGNANKATSATLVGNADVGEEFTAGSADVDTAVTYGTADCDTAKTVATLTNANAIYGNANRAAAATSVLKSITTDMDAYHASYNESDECLVLSPVTITPTSVDIWEATASTTKMSTAIGTTSIIPAKASTKTLTPAKAATKKLNAAKALSATSKGIFEAVESTAKIYGVGGVTNITPAVASELTLTPAVAAPTTQKITPAKKATATIYGAVESTTEIYGVGGEVTVTSATAAPTTQTIVPAVANGTITPYTFADVIAAKKAEEATTVATGALSQTATGAQVMVGTGTLGTATALLNTTTITSGTTGDVEVVNSVGATKNTAAKTISGTAAENGEHNHDVI